MHIDKDLVHLFLSDMIQISTVQNPSKLLKVIVNNLDSNGMNLLLKLKFLVLLKHLMSLL